MSVCISRLVSLFRWKIYKLSMLVSLGRMWGWGLDRNLLYTIPEGCVSEDVSLHVIDVQRLSNPYIQRYDSLKTHIADNIRSRMHSCDAKAVPARNLYLLSKVAISAETGAMWIPNRCAFVESLGNNIHFYAWGGLIDMMRKPFPLSTGMVTPCANLGYYHWLLDSMGQVLIARRKMGDHVKVLVSRHASRFLREGLHFFGIKDDDLVYVDGPALVDKAVMVARNNDLGVIFQDNIKVLRMEIEKRCANTVKLFRKIYVSRRFERNRAIRNEDEVERVVRDAGFEVCYFEKMPFAEQIKTVSEAKVIMGIHGAGLSNIIAGREGLKVIELLNPTWFNTCFAQLASQLGFEYRCALLKECGGIVYADIHEVERLICEYAN